MKNLKLLSDTAILRSQQIHVSKQQEENLQVRCHDLQKEVLGAVSSADPRSPHRVPRLPCAPSSLLPVPHLLESDTTLATIHEPVHYLLPTAVPAVPWLTLACSSFHFFSECFLGIFCVPASGLVSPSTSTVQGLGSEGSSWDVLPPASHQLYVRALDLDLQGQVEALGLKLQRAVTELDNCQEMLTNKSNEADDCQRELRKLKFESIISESRHTRLLKEKEDSLMTCQQIYKALQEELTAKERQEEDTKRRINLSESELEITKALLNQTRQEVTALKNERELMLMSHQKSIEQLQETIRQKMLSDDSWKEKIEAELAKERARHLAEFEEQALLFKEEAKLELDIEKEKHQEIIQKYKKEQEALQIKISDLMAGATRDLRLEVTTLKEKLRDSHIRYSEESESKKKEIENLKNLVAEFESRLKKEIDSNDSVSEDLRKEMKHKSEELERVLLAQTQLIQQLSQSQKENAFLQETVRRECEERSELTQALSQAREQLVALRKLSGSAPRAAGSLRRGSPTLPAPAAGDHWDGSRAALRAGRGVRTPSAPGAPRRSVSPHAGLPALPQLQPPRARAASQRLAATLWRRLSQQ
ncbi:protein LEKR1 isoform X2 [Sciurus carolinensis]|nr:protein LEKR1 isoform X2 [Sciurus carolinensis]